MDVDRPANRCRVDPPSFRPHSAPVPMPSSSHPLLRHWVLPLGLLGFVITAGVASNLVTSAIHRNALVASGSYGSGLVLVFDAFADDVDLPRHFVGERLDVSLAIPFYLQARVTFSDGPDLGDEYRCGMLTCFGARIILWEET
jgi:hypothetical protein